MGATYPHGKLGLYPSQKVGAVICGSGHSFSDVYSSSAREYGEAYGNGKARAKD